MIVKNEYRKFSAPYVRFHTQMCLFFDQDDTARFVYDSAQTTRLLVRTILFDTEEAHQ